MSITAAIFSFIAPYKVKRTDSFIPAEGFSALSLFSGDGLRMLKLFGGL